MASASNVAADGTRFLVKVRQIRNYDRSFLVSGDQFKIYFRVFLGPPDRRRPLFCLAPRFINCSAFFGNDGRDLLRHLMLDTPREELNSEIADAIVEQIQAKTRETFVDVSDPETEAENIPVLLEAYLL